MPDPSNPPRPSLRGTVRDYIAACTWNQGQSRLESGGSPVVAWLTQTGTPGITATVQWEAGLAEKDLESAVPAKIPYDTWNIVKNGTFDAQTGVVTYNGTGYRFRFETVGGNPTMAPYS